ncbi:MAG: efflux RND transporter periplasmic adaptor subunit, partial [Terriglobales bacterium]
PVPVGAVRAAAGSIPIYLRNIGTVAAANTVALHARVDGEVIRVDFQEGQMVHQGDLMVEIDPRPYQASLAQTQGQLAHDTAVYNDDQIDFDRYQSLYKQNIIAKQQLDAQAALVSEYKGAMASDQAAIATATLNLGFCHITAPITGRIGLRQVDAGNVVHASDALGLAVITEVQPIAVLFALPQANLPQVYAALSAGAHPLVAAFDANNVKQLALGRLETIDNSIDAATGTFRLKALFDNADNALFPNQMVNARLQLGSDAGLAIVPPAAVQRGPQGTYVFVISPKSTVSLRDVTVQLTEGNQVGIGKGLAPGESVVVDGADSLEDGSRVEATYAAAADPAAAVRTATAPAAPRHPKPKSAVGADHKPL